MQTQPNLDALVVKLAAAIPELRLPGKEQEEYCTALLRLQHQLDSGSPNEMIVNHCLAYFADCLRKGGAIPAERPTVVKGYPDSLN